MAKIVLTGDAFIDLSEINVDELYGQSSSIVANEKIGVIDVTDPVDDEHFAFVFEGNGFTSYDSHGYATAGTIDHFAYVVGGAFRADFTDFTVDAAELRGAVKNANTDKFIDLIWGGNDNVTLNDGGAAFHGFGGNDKITGAGSNDALWGDDGNDTLKGNAGGDGFVGGLGQDTLIGGAAADVFSYTDVAHSTSGAIDTIKDLQNADILDMELIDADTVAGGDQDFTIVAAFTGTAGELTVTYNAGQDRTSFRGDVNGDGSADLIIFATGDQTGHVAYDL
jgi:hypothetical protein